MNRGEIVNCRNQAISRNISKVTHTDYEGVGVKPDVQVPAKEALPTGHTLALRGVLARTTGEPERKAGLEKLIGELEAKLKEWKRGRMK